MIIERVQLKNYRSLKDITLDELRNFNVFIGKNGSGKSHILEALELFFSDINLYQPVEKGFEDYLWFDRDTTVPVSFNLQITLSQKEINNIFTEDILKTLEPVGIKDVSVRDLEIHREIFKNSWTNKKISLGNWILLENDKIVTKVPVKISQRSKAEGSMPKKDKKSDVATKDVTQELITRILTQMTNLLKGSFKLIRTTRESGEKTAPGAPRVHLIDPETRNYITSIGQSRDRVGSRKWAHYADTFKGFSDLTLEPRGGEIHVRIDDLYVPLNFLGGGDQEILILERQLAEEGEFVFGIEEPETHLHADYVRKMFRHLKLRSKDMQMFIATLSPIFVDRTGF